MATLREQFDKEIVPQLKKDLGVKNINAVPRVQKIVLSVGVGKLSKDAKMIEAVQNTLTRISGQKPAEARSVKAISNFKLREGQVVGYKVTLRGPRMWDFLEKLVKVAFARVRDFRGISVKHIDANGNMSLGFKEHLQFPEIKNDEVDRVHGVEVTIQTNAGTRIRGEALLRALGFPFKDSFTPSKK